MIGSGAVRHKGIILHLTKERIDSFDRSLENFDINQPYDRMPPTLIRAFGFLKWAKAKVNVQQGLLGQFFPVSNL